MSELTPIRTAGKRERRYPVSLRQRILRLLFGRNRKLSFSRRLTFLSRRYRIAASTIWRWVRRYRQGGADALRDHLRSDALTRRTPGLLSIATGAPARLQLDAVVKQAERSIVTRSIVHTSEAAPHPNGKEGKQS